MIGVIKTLYLNKRFYLAGGSVVALFIFGFAFVPLYYAGLIALLILFALIATDIILLFRKNVSIRCHRNLPLMLSLSDENKIVLDLSNDSYLRLKIHIIEELPEQFQERKFWLKTILDANQRKTIEYNLRPVKRGEHFFGKTILFIRSELGLVERRVDCENSSMVPVYPSIIQMKNMELRAFSKISLFQGIRKLRRIGHSYEFEQIRSYVTGDDYRSINWKSTGKRGALMVNQYEDERAQQIYFILDKSRVMRSSFNELSLLDYAINSSLVMTNIALRKDDKVGLISFSTSIDTFIKAEKSSKQLRLILNKLYKEKENKLESNYELLYSSIRKTITARSLLVLFTNFESIYALDRVLPLLRKLSRFHLLVVVFFENTELTSYAKEDAKSLKDIYFKMVAEKFIDEKEQIIHQLNLYGIQSIRSSPEELSINVINKYLELKSRGMI
jgi:uncharacterized protein (DUF58 family)